MPKLSAAQLDCLHAGLDGLGIQLATSQTEKIVKHLALVQQWRDKINLVSYSKEQELITHHALDSLSVLPYIEDSQCALDIGTGAGFPGMVLAAALPNTQFTLLDSRQRRIEFLRMVAAQSSLSNVRVINSRVEVFAAGQAGADREDSSMQPRQKFDTLIARAVASLSVLVEMTSSLQSRGVRLVAMKGRHPIAEIEALDKNFADRYSSVGVESVGVPYLPAQRHIVTINFCAAFVG